MDASQIVDLATKSGVAADDRENLVSFALGFADGARNRDSTETVNIFGMNVSPNVTPVMIFGDAAGVPNEFHVTDLMKGEHLQPQFLEMNSYHTIPTIKHGDFCLHESSTILRYVARAFPNSAGRFYGNGDLQTQAIIDCALDKRAELYKTTAPVLYGFMGFMPKPSDEVAAQVNLTTMLALSVKC